MDMSPGAWLLTLVVVLAIVWAGFIAWSGGLGKRWLQAWGLQGARLFKKPATLVAPPEVHRQPHHGHGKAHGHGPADAHAPHGGVQPHRSGNRKGERHGDPH